jgi:hypothetical protein
LAIKAKSPRREQGWLHFEPATCRSRILIYETNLSLKILHNLPLVRPNSGLAVERPFLLCG